MKVLVRFALAAGAAVGLSALVLPAAAGGILRRTFPRSPRVAIMPCSCRRTTQLGTRSWRTTAIPTVPWRLPEPTPPEALVAFSTDGCRPPRFARLADLRRGSQPPLRGDAGATRFRFSRCTELSSPCAR